MDYIEQLVQLLVRRLKSNEVENFNSIIWINAHITFWNNCIEDYSTIQWMDSGNSLPTIDVINAKIAELDAAEPMRLLREERFSSSCRVWLDTGVQIVPDSIKTAWQTYRQQLRDLPASASPKLDEFYELDLSSVTWPSKTFVINIFSKLTIDIHMI